MTAQYVEWDGETIAIVVTPGEGRRPYLVDPVVFDEAGNLIMGAEVLTTIATTGIEMRIPIIRGATPAYLARLDAKLAQVRETLNLETDDDDELPGEDPLPPRGGRRSRRRKD